MDKLNEYINNFVLEKPNYYNHVNAFREYCLTANYRTEFLQGIRTSSLIKALSDYIETRNVSSRTAALLYTYAIKDFLLYLISNQKLDNEELKIQLLLPTYEEQSYRYQMNNFISKHKSLSDNDSFGLFDSTQIDNLIKECDNTLSSDTVSNKAYEMKKYFNKFRSAIIVKLIILTGIRYEVIPDLGADCLDLINSRITINGFELILPSNLCSQFKLYEKIVDGLLVRRYIWWVRSKT